MDEFLTVSLPYISRPHFPQRFVMKKYKEHKERQKWYR